MAVSNEEFNLIMFGNMDDISWLQNSPLEVQEMVKNQYDPEDERYLIPVCYLKVKAYPLYAFPFIILEMLFLLFLFIANATHWKDHTNGWVPLILAAWAFTWIIAIFITKFVNLYGLWKRRVELVKWLPHVQIVTICILLLHTVFGLSVVKGGLIRKETILGVRNQGELQTIAEGAYISIVFIVIELFGYVVCDRVVKWLVAYHDFVDLYTKQCQRYKKSCVFTFCAISQRLIEQAATEKRVEKENPMGNGVVATAGSKFAAIANRFNFTKPKIAPMARHGSVAEPLDTRKDDLKKDSIFESAPPEVAKVASTDLVADMFQRTNSEVVADTTELVDSQSAKSEEEEESMLDTIGIEAEMKKEIKKERKRNESAGSVEENAVVIDMSAVSPSGKKGKSPAISPSAKSPTVSPSAKSPIKDAPWPFETTNGGKGVVPQERQYRDDPRLAASTQAQLAASRNTVKFT